MPITGAPQAADYITATLAKLWELIDGSDFLSANLKHAVAGDFLNGKRDQDKQGAPTNRMNAGPSDCKALTIEIDSFRVLNPNVMPTFCNTRGTTGDRVVEQEITFKFTIVYDSLDLNLPNQVAVELSTVLLDDPRLGLSQYVKSVGRLSMRDRIADKGAAKGTRRLVQEFTFPVTYSLHRSTLFPG